jgi:hypothetical protein
LYERFQTLPIHQSIHQNHPPSLTHMELSVLSKPSPVNIRSA